MFAREVLGFNPFLNALCTVSPSQIAPAASVGPCKKRDDVLHAVNSHGANQRKLLIPPSFPLSLDLHRGPAAGYDAGGIMLSQSLSWQGGRIGKTFPLKTLSGGLGLQQYGLERHILPLDFFCTKCEKRLDMIDETIYIAVGRNLYMICD